MKIVLINSFYFPDEPGGAEHSVRLLAESLHILGHEVTVICLGDRRQTAYVNGVRVERLPIRNIYLPRSSELQPKGVSRIKWHLKDIRNKNAASDVADLLRIIKPDVFHSNNLSGFSVSVWLAAYRLSIPVVHTTRDFYLLCPKTTMMKSGLGCDSPCISCAPFAIYRRIASNVISYAVGISRFILDRHLNNGCFSRASSSVIYNSFDAPDPVYRALGKEIKIGYIGRLVPSKGVALLLDVFSRVQLELKIPVRLLIAGDGRDDYISELKAKAEGMPVEFLGRVNSNDFFPMLDFLVVPSIWSEPLGRVVIESFAFGKPVVITPVGGMPELITGLEGVIAKSSEIEDVYKAIVLMIEKLKLSGEAVFSSAINRAADFKLDNIAKQYELIYEKVLMKGTV